ncbi:MAG: radical SAM protein [Planctomycetota bacterium]
MTAPGAADPSESLEVPELPPYRPPSEADSILLRVTRGCAWNRCRFCAMYGETPFECRPLAHVLRDVAGWAALHPRAGSVFLADSDALEHPELAEIVAAVRRAFPALERVTSYTRLTTLRRRTAPKLALLRAAGLTRLHAGLESGSAEVLRRARKGLRPDIAIEGAEKALDAGFELSLYVLSGLGGEDAWEEHARESGRLVAAVWPHFLRLRSLLLFAGTDLREEWERGAFRPASPGTRLREVRALLAELAPAAPPARDLVVTSDHFSNVVWADRRQVYAGVEGRLPAERAAMFALLDGAIASVAASEVAADPTAFSLTGRLRSG